MKNGYLLCFDLDGTLIDSRNDIAAAVNHMLRTYNLSELTEKRVAEIIGHGIFKTASSALKEAGAENIDERAAGEIAADYYYEHPVNKTKLYDGVCDGLKKLYELGFTTGIITNKLQALTEKVLDILDIRRYFDYIVGAEGGFPMKPDPAAVIWMSESSGIPISKTFMIGDGRVDLQTGKNAGAKTVLVTYGYRTSGELSSDISADSFKELTDKLEKLLI